MTRRMHIGIVCPYSFDHPGGVQAHVLDLARVLRHRGHDVRVLGPAGETVALPDYVTRGGSSVAIPYNGSVARLSFGPRVNATVKRFIQDGRFDVLHLHEPNSPSYSMAALYYAEGPLVATYHAATDSSRVLRAFLPLMRPYLEKIRGGIAVSEMARRWQVEQLGGDPVLIPNGVDTAGYRAAYLRHHAEKGEKPARDAIPEIAFLGRLDEPRKGLDVLLAAKTLMQHSARFTVMGGGTPRDVPGVDFVGQVSDEEKENILGRADIYVAPNTGGESFGIVLVEAMAAGCSVVASDLEAFAAVCDSGSAEPAGVLFRNGDADELAHTLDRLVVGPVERAALRAAGQRRAARYDWSTVCDDVVAVYETVADGTVVEVR